MKMNYSLVSVIVLVILLSAGTSLGDVQPEKTSPSHVETVNRQIYLGYASIYGDGPTSTLYAKAENIRIGVASPSETLDFYIDYDITCDGIADSGTITLFIDALNGINLTDAKMNLELVFTKKNGSISIKNFTVKRLDIVTFRIDVLYTSPSHPNLGKNHTESTGYATFSRSTTILSEIYNHPLLQFIRRTIEKQRCIKHMIWIN